jgi:hypothetical protein
MPFNNYVDKMMGEGVKNVLILSTLRGVHAGCGGQKWQNSVHVAVECSLK